MDAAREADLTRGPVVLITGGAGFLGRALVRELKRSALAPREIRVFDLRHDDRGGDVVSFRGDVRSHEELLAACRGVDVVLHAAAIIDWGQHPERLVEEVNVRGTENVIRACNAAGVRALVHTSTLDVVYTGRPIRDGDESLPYPERHVNAYCRTKAEAEQLVLAADEPGGLRTTVIRPCCIFGEGDPYHASSLIRMARWAPMFRIGSGRARAQHVYVGNVAHAHLLAARRLLEDPAVPAGQVYFVTDFPAQNFFDYMEPILRESGGRMLPWALSLPRPAMFGLACLMEAAAWTLRPVHSFTPLLSRFAVDFVCQDFTLSGDRAARDLGYRPIYTEEEAFDRTIDYFRAHGPVEAPRYV